MTSVIKNFDFIRFIYICHMTSVAKCEITHLSSAKCGQSPNLSHFHTHLSNNMFGLERIGK